MDPTQPTNQNQTNLNSVSLNTEVVSPPLDTQQVTAPVEVPPMVQDYQSTAGVEQTFTAPVSVPETAPIVNTQGISTTVSTVVPVQDVPQSMPISMEQPLGVEPATFPQPVTSAPVDVPSAPSAPVLSTDNKMSPLNIILLILAAILILALGYIGYVKFTSPAVPVVAPAVVQNVVPTDAPAPTEAPVVVAPTTMPGTDSPDVITTVPSASPVATP